MASRDLAIGTLFLSQTAVGILGNFSLLYHYVFLYFSKCRLRSTDVIIMQLNVANTLVLLSKGIPETTAALGLRDFLGDVGCKLLFYVHKVGRDVSMGSTCLLSVFQAITISPLDSRWAELKAKAPKYLGTASVLCWLLNMLLNIKVLLAMTAKWSNRNNTNKRDYGYCSAVLEDISTHTFYVPMVLGWDLFFVGLMVWASGSMVSMLYKHKQQVRHLHKTISPRISPESRATQSILLLVSTFVSLCTLSSISHVALAILNSYSLWLVNVSTLLTGCFPMLSPYILLSRDSRVSRPHWDWTRKTEPPDIMRDT